MDLTIKIYTAFSGIDAFDKINVMSFFESNDTKSNNEHLDSSINAVLKTVPSYGGFLITLTKAEEIIAGAIVNFTGMQPYFPSSFITHIAILKDNENKQDITDKLIQSISSHLNKNINILLKTTHPLYKFLRASSFKEKGRFLYSSAD